MYEQLSRKEKDLEERFREIDDLNQLLKGKDNENAKVSKEMLKYKD